MKKLLLFIFALILISVVLIGSGCSKGGDEKEEGTKTDAEIVKGLMKDIANELGWPTNTPFIKSFAGGPKFVFNDVGDWEHPELHITAELSEPEECKIFLSGTFGEFSTFRELEISGFTICENITYQHLMEYRKDECLSTYKGYASWMRTYVGGYEFRTTGSKACTEEFSVQSLMTLLIKHINKHYKNGKWQ